MTEKVKSLQLFPGRRTLTGAGVLAGIGAGLVALVVTVVYIPDPLGIHEGIWSLLINVAVALSVSAVTAPPSLETKKRIHGELERYVYGTEE